jgi:hypothetical protein
MEKKKSRQTRGFTGAIILVLACLAGCAGVEAGRKNPGDLSAATSAAGAARAFVAAPVHDFGTIMEGETVSRAFVVENRGAGHLIIKPAFKG